MRKPPLSENSKILKIAALVVGAVNLFKNPKILDVAVYFAVDKGVGKLLMAIHKSTGFWGKEVINRFIHSFSTKLSTTCA